MLGWLSGEQNVQDGDFVGVLRKNAAIRKEKIPLLTYFSAFVKILGVCKRVLYTLNRRGCQSRPFLL